MKQLLNRAITMAMVLLGAGVIGTSITGCGGDDPVEPVDLGSSKVTFLHANPGRSSGVAFFRADTMQVGSGTTAYASFFNATLPNAERAKYSVKAADGTTLRSATSAQDSAREMMVIYTGSATSDSLVIATSQKITPGTKAAVRFIHAAQGATARDLRIGDPQGPAIAQNVSYRGSNGAYITLSTDTESLWIVDPSDSTNNREVTIDPQAGEGYSIVFIGAENPVDPAFGWQGLIVADPD